jgi:pheromone shutdown protein TraB
MIWNDLINDNFEGWFKEKSIFSALGLQCKTRERLSVVIICVPAFLKWL